MRRPDPRPRLLGWSIGGLVAGGLLAVLGWGLAHPGAGAPSPIAGRPAPDLVVRTFAGPSVSVSSFKGRPLVLNFWASWCTPCRQEAPVLAAASRAGDGAEFLGAAIQDSEAPARAFEAEFQVPYQDGLDTEGGYLRYGVTGPPETFFIDRQGIIRYRHQGPLDAATLRTYLDRIKP
jgi:cytochrome c biogenesis protein CcmG/thiol:disulfide interchange protein DsbE